MEEDKKIQDSSNIQSDHLVKVPWSSVEGDLRRRLEYYLFVPLYGCEDDEERPILTPEEEEFLNKIDFYK